jgi:hypothetical protein
MLYSNQTGSSVQQHLMMAMAPPLKESRKM